MTRHNVDFSFKNSILINNFWQSKIKKSLCQIGFKNSSSQLSKFFLKLNFWTKNGGFEQCANAGIFKKGGSQCKTFLFFSFQGPDWQYRTELPAWAKEDWIDPEDY